MKCILALLCAAQMALGASPTDLALLRQAVCRAAEDLKPEVTGQSICLVGNGSSEGDLLVRDVLTAFLETKGCTVYYDRAKGDFELQYRVADLAVYYRKKMRSFLFGPARVERQARAELDLFLLAAGKVVGGSNLFATVQDTIPERDLPLVRSRNFTRDETIVETRSPWEPVLVLAITAALILIFYAPRSY